MAVSESDQSRGTGLVLNKVLLFVTSPKKTNESILFLRNLTHHLKKKNILRKDKSFNSTQ